MTARDGTIEERTYFFTIWICCGVLVIFALWNVRRGKQVYPEFETSMQQFSQLRWLTLLNTLLQAQCFVGYYVNSSVITETAWVVWVTTAGWCLATLGVRTAQASYDLCNIEDQGDGTREREVSDTRNTRNTGKTEGTYQKLGLSRAWFYCGNKDGTVIVIIYVFWSASAIINIVGTVVAWKYSTNEDYSVATKIQFLSFGSWRFLSAICLSCTVYRLMHVYRLTVKFLNQVKNDSNEQYLNQSKLQTVTSSIKVMKTLTICIFVLIAVLLVGSFIDFEYFVQLWNQQVRYHKQRNNLSNYGTEQIPSWQVAYVYFPLWTFVQIISLVYCWVPEHYLWSAIEELTCSTLNGGSSQYY